MHRLLSAFLLLLATTVLTGCVSRMNQGEIEELQIRYRGQPIDENLWSKVDQIREKTPERPIGRTTMKSWLLPAFAQQSNFAVSVNSQRARTTRFTWNDLSSPLLITFLPLRITYSEYVYNREGTEAIGAKRLFWNPLWAGSSKRGDVDENTRLKAAGVPLFYSHVSIENRDTQNTLKFYNALWTLGPAVMKTEANGPEGEVSGYAATPLLLGGILGVILWTDYQLESDQARLIGHGPFGGLLGYWQIGERYLDEEAAAQRPRMDDRIVRQRGSRFILGGILWHDFEFRDGDGKTIRSGNGPLWSAFGWGRKNDRFAPRIFFINI